MLRLSRGNSLFRPIWVAGKKTFGMARYAAKRLTLCFWVGVDQQGLLTADPRYEIKRMLQSLKQA